MKNTYLETPFQYVETLQHRKLYYKTDGIDALCFTDSSPK